jgi:hypothetical protein
MYSTVLRTSVNREDMNSDFAGVIMKLNSILPLEGFVVLCCATDIIPPSTSRFCRVASLLVETLGGFNYL